MGENACCDLNSKNFGVDSYVKQIIKDHSLSQLLDQENGLKKEIKLLDNDMQSLVYENYNKFINATDVVQNLKCNFGAIENMIKDVSVKMDEVIKSHTELLNDMKPNKEKIIQFTEMDNELKKMQFVFELPSRLKDILIKEQKFSQVMNEYNIAYKILEKQKEMKTFQDINKECKIIIKDMYIQILEIANKENLSPIEFYEKFEILKQIVVNSSIDFDQINGKLSENELEIPRNLPNLVQTYIEIFRKKCLNYVKSLKDKFTETPSTNTNIKDYISFAEEVNEKFLKIFGSYLIFYKILFGQQSNDLIECHKMYENECGKILNELIIQVINPFYMTNVEEETFSTKNSISLNIVLDSYEPLFAKSLDKIYKKICNISLTLKNSGGGISSDSNQLLLTEFPDKHNKYYTNKNINQLIKVKDLFNFNLELENIILLYCLIPIIHNRIKSYFVASSLKFDNALSETSTKLQKINQTPKIMSEDPNLLREICKNFASTFTGQIKGVVKKLQCYLNQEDITFIEDPLFRDSLLKYGIFGNFIFPYLHHLLNALQVHENTTESVDIVIRNLLFILFKSQVAHEFYVSGYDNLISFTHDTFKTVPRPVSITFSTPSSSSQAKSKQRQFENLNQFAPEPQILDKMQFKEAAQAALNYFVFVNGSQLGAMFECDNGKSVNWTGGVSSFVQTIPNKIEIIDLQVGQIYSDSTTAGGGGGPNTNTSSRSSKERYHQQQKYSFGNSSTSGINKGGYSHSLSSHAPTATIKHIGLSDRHRTNNLLNNHISKLFSEKIVIFQDITAGNKDSIVTGIIKICLKSILENIRLHNYDTSQFQQIQLDLHYLLLYLWRFVTNEKVLQSLLDEILSSAAIRCFEPIIFLEQETIDRMCTETTKKL